MTSSTHRADVRVQTYGATKAQAEIQQLYRSSTQNVERLTQSVTKFGHHNFAAFAIFKGLAIYRGFGMVTQQLGEGVQQAIAFEKSMANVNSLLQVGQIELLRYSDYLAELGQALPLTMQELADGMYDVVSAGITAENQIKKVVALAGKAAVAGVTSLKNAVQAGIGTMNAFGKSVDDLDHIYDVHFMTVKMGILTYEQLNQVLGRTTATAALAGQGMETATAALVAVSRGGFGGVAFAEGSTRVVRFFQELGDPSTHEAIRKLGIQVFDSFGKMRNAIDIVIDINAELADMTEEARMAQVRQMFTNIRSAQGFQVLSEQIDIWQEAQMRSIFSTDAMTDAFDKQMQSVSATMTTMANKFTNAMRDIVVLMHPALKGLNHMFDALGQNLAMITIMIGILGARYLISAINAKHLANAEMLHVVSTQLVAESERRAALATTMAAQAGWQEIMMTKASMVQHELKNLTLQKSFIVIELETLAKKKQTTFVMQAIVARKAELAVIEQEILTRQKLIPAMAAGIGQRRQNVAQINNEMIALDGGIAKMQTELLLLKFRRTAMIGNVAAMGGMIAGMGLMTWAAAEENEVLRIAGAVIMAASLAIQIYVSLVPMFVAAAAARTAATEAEAIAMTHLAGATTVATGGISAMTAAAGVAIVFGAITAATIALGSAQSDATDKTDDMVDSLSDLADVAGDTTEGMTTWIRELIRAGDTLDIIIKKVDLLSGGMTGMTAASMQELIKYGYTKVGGTEMMKVPTGVFPEEIGEGTTDFEMALKSLSYTSKEILGIHQEDATLLLDVQDELLAIEDTVQRNAMTTMIFGDKFGQALISMWDTAGKKWATATTEVAAVMEHAANRSAIIKQNIADTLVDAKMVEMPGMSELEAGQAMVALEKGGFGAHITKTGGFGGDIYTIQMPVEAFELIPKNITHAMLEAAYAPQEMSDELKEAIIEWRAQNDEEYVAMMNATDSIFVFSDLATSAVVQTMSEILAETKEMYDEWMSGLQDLMKIDDMIDSIVDAGDILDAAGYEFMGVAGNWDALGEQWAKIQKMWMGLQMMQTLMSVADSMANLPEDLVGKGEATAWEARPTAAAEAAIAKQASAQYAAIKKMIDYLPEGHLIRKHWQKWIDAVDAAAEETEQVATEWEPKYGGLQADIYQSLIPIFQQLAPGLASSLAEMLEGLLGNFGDPNFWDTFLDDAEEVIIETIEEMAETFLDTVTGAGGFGDAIAAFVEHGEVLDSAGYYFRGVAENWYLLGEEWARIQAYFKVTEMINSFIQAAGAMKEFGVEVPAAFEENMFALMQMMATNVLPDFQSVIDSLMDQIGTEGFWGALADGMSEAQITQSNSIVLAPYIIIEERADAEEIIELVHKALVDSATKAGFSWQG